MATDAERYLHKAHESLASAKADARARRYNSAANRAYYAAFQAAVAALIQEGIRPAPKKGSDPGWEHRFVMSKFSGKLVWRRGLFADKLQSVLKQLFDDRIVADYAADDISQKRVSRGLRRSEAIVTAVATRFGTISAGEIRGAYGGMVKTSTRSPRSYVEELKRKMLENYPDLTFKVRRRSARDFTLDVYGDYDDMWDVYDAMGDLDSDILIQHDVWIVVLPHQRDRN